MSDTERKEILNLTHDDMIKAAKKVALSISRDFRDGPDIVKIYSVPRMGIPCTYLAANYINLKFKLIDLVEDADVIIDDIIDSGATKNRMLELNPHAKFYALFDSKNYGGVWLSYPMDRGLNNEDSGIEVELLRLSQHTGFSIDEIKTRLEIN